MLQRADRGDTAAWAQVKEMRAHPERYVPERVALIDTMAAQSQIEVPPSSQCRELELTDIIFSRDLTTNPHFAKVEIISGAAKGQVGWTCFPGDIHRTNAMP